MDNINDLYANESKGFARLRKAVQQDCSKAGGILNESGCSQCVKGCFHRYCDKFKWIVDRARHYEEVLNIPFKEILDGWEERRTCWYMGYYEEHSQPLLAGAGTRVFDTVDAFNRSLGSRTFLCPACGRVSESEQKCTVCSWDVSGFLGDMGKGVFVYIKENKWGKTIFMPIAWESEERVCYSCSHYDMNDPHYAFGTCEILDEDFHCTHDCTCPKEEIRLVESLQAVRDLRSRILRILPPGTRFSAKDKEGRTRYYQLLGTLDVPDRKGNGVQLRPIGETMEQLREDVKLDRQDIPYSLRLHRRDLDGFPSCTVGYAWFCEYDITVLNT